MEDIGWLDVKRIHGPGTTSGGDIVVGMMQGKNEPPEQGFALSTDYSRGIETQVLKELYAYCWYEALIPPAFFILIDSFLALV
jgi:hypothetical protein